MPLHGVVEVLIHFDEFRNVDLYHQGLYQLRVRLSVPKQRESSVSNTKPSSVDSATPVAPSKVFALPYNWFTSRSKDPGERANSEASKPSFHDVKQACISDSQAAFYSRSFLVRYCEEQVPLGDFCQFRLELPCELLVPEKSSVTSETVIACDIDLLYGELKACSINSNINLKSERMLKEATTGSGIELKRASTVRLLLHHIQDGLYECVPVVFDEAHFCSVKMLICATLSDFRFRLPPPQPEEVVSSDVLVQDTEADNLILGAPVALRSVVEPNTLEEFLKLKEAKEVTINASSSETAASMTCSGSSEYMHIMEGAYGHLESFFYDVTSRCSTGSFKVSLAEKLSIPHNPPEEAGPKSVAEIMATMNVLAVSSFELWHRLLEVLAVCSRKVCDELLIVWERNTIEKLSHCISCVTETVDSTRDLAFPLEDDIWEVHKIAADRVREKLFMDPPERLCSVEDTTQLVISQKEAESTSTAYMHRYSGMATMPIIFEQRYSSGNSPTRGAGDVPVDSTESHRCMATDPKSYKGTHLVVLVHGLQGSAYDMRLFKNNLACVFPDSLFLCSSCNEEDTEGNIAEMGQRLADEVVCYISDWCPGAALTRLSFISHSLGGLIVRAALPTLMDQPGISEKLFTFLSLSAPHLGYLYNSNKLIEGGLWVLKRWRKSECLNQLTMADSYIPEECYLYRSARETGEILPRFRYVVLASSCQDQYAGFDSARVEISDRVRQEPTMGSVYTEMARSLVAGIAPEKLIRLDVNFYLPERSLDSLIGRAAHIQFIENQPLMKMIIHNYSFLFQ